MSYDDIQAQLKKTPLLSIISFLIGSLCLYLGVVFTKNTFLVYCYMLEGKIWNVYPVLGTIFGFFVIAISFIIPVVTTLAGFVLSYALGISLLHTKK